MKKLFFTLLVLPLISISAQQKSLDTKVIRGNVMIPETINLDFIKSKDNIHLEYVDGVKFAYLDSVHFEDRHPDKLKLYTTYKDLDFSNEISIYSPEYYSLATSYYSNKAMLDYNKLFEGKIDFNSQADCRNIEVVVGDFAEMTSPRKYIYKKGANISTSIIYHEVGHKAFWLLEDSLNIQFKGLSLIHMGLLEYLTMSFNDSHLVGEEFLPSTALRSGNHLYSYQQTDTLNVESLMLKLRAEYADEMKNPQSSFFKLNDAYNYTLGDRLLTISDNHRGGMILATTLWRIREQLGAELTNKLVAKTILNLNTYMQARESYYRPASFEKLNPEKIEWIDVYKGLIEQDALLNNGNGKDIIYKEFKKTEYPVEGII